MYLVLKTAFHFKSIYFPICWCLTYDSVNVGQSPIPLPQWLPLAKFKLASKNLLIFSWLMKLSIWELQLFQRILLAFIFPSNFCYLSLAILRIILIKYHWFASRASLFNTNQQSSASKNKQVFTLGVIQGMAHTQITVHLDFSSPQISCSAELLSFFPLALALPTSPCLLYPLLSMVPCPIPCSSLETLQLGQIPMGCDPAANLPPFHCLLLPQAVFLEFWKIKYL